MDLAELVGTVGEQHVLAFMLALARIAPLFVLAPLFSNKQLTPRVKGIAAVALAIGGDGWLIQGLARTYELVPLMEAPALGSLVEGTQKAFVGIAVAAVEIAAPVLLALVITDAAFGVVSKVMPQLNVFAMGFPAKVAVGLLIIGVSMPFFAGFVADELQRSVALALRSLKVA